MRSPLKLAFHDADTDTDTAILADIVARIVARMSVSVSVSWNASFTRPSSRSIAQLQLLQISTEDIPLYNAPQHVAQ